MLGIIGHDFPSSEHVPEQQIETRNRHDIRRRLIWFPRTHTQDYTYHITEQSVYL